jgi:hypothetical protein
MNKCAKCGRDMPDNWPDRWCSVCMDELGTFLIYSPYNPGM